MQTNPKISVLMGVYNAEEDLKSSIESILNQTYEDFELIIINDGSTDSSREIIEAYAQKDARIHLVNQENMGLTKALNKGIAVSRGKYIARQDADDVSYPHRLKKQIDLMESNEAIVLSGSNCDDLYADGSTGEWGAYAPDELQKVVFLKTPFAHSTIMMRADICKELGGYDENFKTSQDMELWMRFAKKGMLAMIEEPLIQRKIVAGSISQKRRWRQFYDAFKARWKHNHGINRLHSIYYGIRSLIIGLLPASCIRFLKGHSKT